jgi:hypothetical protein
MDASVQSRATTVASAPMSRMSSILDLVAGNSDFFQFLASLTSQAATLIRRISLPRAILDHSSATIEAIHAHQPAKSGGTVSVPTTTIGSASARVRVSVGPVPGRRRDFRTTRLPDRTCLNGSGDGVARLLTFEAH